MPLIKRLRDRIAAHRREARPIAEKLRPLTETDHSPSVSQQIHDLLPKQRNRPMQNILGGIFDGLLRNILNWQLVQGYIRSALLAIGGWIGLDALVGQDGTNTIIGAVLVIFSVIWQAIDNNMKKKAFDVVKAVEAHPAISVTPAADTGTNKPVVAVSAR